MSFILSKGVNNNTVFLTNYSDITEKRWDPSYQHLFKIFLEKISKSQFPIERLRDSISYLQYGTSERATEEPVGTAVLRMANMQKEVWDLGTLKYLNVSQEEKEHYLLKIGDLLFNRTNSKELVGKCTEFNLDGDYIFASYLIRVRLNTEKLLPQYVTAFLSSNLGRMQIDAVSRQIAGMTNINAEEIKDLLIPVPNRAQQLLLVKKMEDAFHLKQKKEQEAQDLLDGIDDYLLKELGIELPKEEYKDVSERIFTRLFTEVSGERFDPHYYRYCQTTMSSINYREYSVRKLAFLRKGQSITKDNITEGEYPVIAGGQKSPYSIDRYNCKGTTITVSASGASSGYVWFHDYPLFASDCTVLKVKDESEILPRFLFEVLKLKQNEIYNLQQGAAQPHVYASDLEKITIPLPTIDEQKTICEYIENIRYQAKIKHQDATDILTTAKTEFEQLIFRGM